MDGHTVVWCNAPPLHWQGSSSHLPQNPVTPITKPPHVKPPTFPHHLSLPAPQQESRPEPWQATCYQLTACCATTIKTANNIPLVYLTQKQDLVCRQAHNTAADGRPCSAQLLFSISVHLQSVLRQKHSTQSRNLCTWQRMKLSLLGHCDLSALSWDLHRCVVLWGNHLDTSVSTSISISN